MGAGSRPGPGIIPAYAGSTPCGTLYREDYWDHPRIRGEHSAPSSRLPPSAGSSPHTRGARPGYRPRRTATGIIPAYAGSTPLGRLIWIALWDHPRIRGEHGRVLWGRCRGTGSSPHTRGALALQVAWEVIKRIIPAYAGSTLTTLRRRHSLPDHPRIRGEHLAGLGRIIGGVGSSPHTRGARMASTPHQVQHGIIPAYAGSTPGGFLMPAVSWDHPRIRGEHSWKSLQYQGSPP